MTPREMAETIFLKFLLETSCHSQHPQIHHVHKTEPRKELPMSTPSSFGLSCLLLSLKRWVEMNENVILFLALIVT